MTHLLSIYLFLFVIMKKTIYTLFLLLSFINIKASDKLVIQTSGDILEYLMPACALTSTFIWQDGSKPTWQFVKSFGTAVGTAYVLKQLVKKKRPDFNVYDPRYDSFPSGHTTSAFASAAFLERRYGWKVGVPSYLLAGYVGWSRVYAERHDWLDVLGGAVIGTASSYLFTKAYKKEGLSISMHLVPDHYQIGIIHKF